MKKPIRTLREITEETTKKRFKGYKTYSEMFQAQIKEQYWQNKWGHLLQ